ncbi:MmyB family transcriptional regulator [Asanoa siamensis]|nr:helix-turn-helix domain-containing protein [Asanoa siamensis]
MSELGTFLRSRREAVAPADVGLPAGRRRRTPGLRRAELAMLAGVSVEYLARLEQGTDRHPSLQVLHALADALLLAREDRELLLLTAKSAGGLRCPRADPASAVRPTVRRLLDGLEPLPAVLLDRLGDVLAHTRAYERLVGPIGLLDDRPANLVRYLCTDDRARTAFPDRERMAGEQATVLRLAAGSGDEAAVALAAELGAAPGFTRRWEMPASTGVERLVHPDVGLLRLAYETLDVAADGQRVLVYLPADEPTEAALDRLARDLVTAAGG